MEGVAEEKCALVAELVKVLEMARQLETHMAAVQQQQQQQGGGGGAGGGGADQRCRALVSTMRASIDRAVHMAVSCCAEGRPGAGGQPESPASGGDGGSPRSAGSDQAGEFRGRGSVAGQCKKRKTMPKWSTQVRVSTVQDVSPLDDGLSWRKYGQKDILGAKYPRSYFRCTHRHTQSCQASKQVQRTDGDPLLFDVVYHGAHTCAQGAAAHPSNQPAVQEQTTTSPGLEAGPAAVLPFSLRPASNKPTTGAGDTSGGAATSSRFVTTAGCVSVTASPFVVSPATTPESQMVSGGGYEVCGGGRGATMAGVRNVPDVELVSTTNSPMAMGEMDFLFPLDDADFLELGNPASYF